SSLLLVLHYIVFFSVHRLHLDLLSFPTRRSSDLENTIDRFTAVATPRQIERVIRGSKFDFELIYDVEKESEVEEDIQLVKTGLELLENDYLGGSGSRGYGKVKFENLSIKPVLGNYDVKGLDAILEG